MAFEPYARARAQQWFCIGVAHARVYKAEQEFFKTLRSLVEPVKPGNAVYKTATNPCKTGKTGRLREKSLTH